MPLDVGQGDAALIRTAKGDILIDAGTNASEDELKAYIGKTVVLNTRIGNGELLESYRGTLVEEA